ncbi:MAG: hypothetical protein IPL07_10875 [Acidimicrobiaceae bacterium]|jgi:hypothetical protein|nr:hypothetical protein [Acidimicrobiaceae bacterium]
MTDEPVDSNPAAELDEQESPTPPAADDSALTSDLGVETSLEETAIASPRPADRPRQVITIAALVLIAVSVALVIISIVNQ